MDGRKAPRPKSLTLLRRCEAGRLQNQLLSLAYQRVCPQVRQAVHDVRAGTRTVDRNGGPTRAARAAAGA